VGDAKSQRLSALQKIVVRGTRPCWSPLMNDFVSDFEQQGVQMWIVFILVIGHSN